MYDNDEFNEKIEEFKNYLIESTQSSATSEIAKLNDKNEKLRQENRMLSNKNNELQKRLKTSVQNDISSQILSKYISECNIYDIIEVLFHKTFDENTCEVPEFWSTYVNYYNDRKEIILLLRSVGVEMPDKLEDIVLPHEWNEELLDKFFDTMYSHYNCNGTTYKDNLRFWTYQMAAHPFDTKFFSCYDEIPWQFLLRNPLLNSKKYAKKIAKEMNKGDYGVYFSKICDYQELSQDVLQTIIDNLELVNNEKVANFLIEHISLVTNEKKLDKLYSTLVNKYGGVKYILQMPQKYQILYAKSLSSTEKMIEFLKLTKLSKEKKMELLGDVFE